MKNCGHFALFCVFEKKKPNEPEFGCQSAVPLSNTPFFLVERGAAAGARGDRRGLEGAWGKKRYNTSKLRTDRLETMRQTSTNLVKKGFPTPHNRRN
jgi:hypothetical protein